MGKVEENHLKMIKIAQVGLHMMEKNNGAMESIFLQIYSTVVPVKVLTNADPLKNIPSIIIL